MRKIDYLENLRKIAEDNGGELLSDTWTDNISRYKFKHHTGEIFEAFAYVIKKNGWPKVLHKYKNDDFRMEQMKQIAKENNGELISDTWINTKTFYLFSNKNGVLFERSYNKLLQYGWPKTEKSINQDEIDLQDLRDKADKNGFELLEKNWIGIYHKYRFKDRVSEIECLISARSIRQNGFPQEPEEIQNFNYLNKLRAIAELDGFILLENEWKGIKYEYSFYKNDFVIKVKGNDLLRRNKLVLSEKKLKIEFKVKKEKPDYLQMMKDIALLNNGKLLSTQWKGSKKKYSFETSDGKLFQRSYKTLKEVGWLKHRYVPPKLNQLDDLKNIAKLNNGELLSTVWKGYKSKYKFKYNTGEMFAAYAYRILRGKWPKNLTKYRDKEYFFNEMRMLASERGGLLLSDTYINKDTKYKFMDAYGEEFEMSCSMLKNGNWNGSNGFISEPVVRQTLNHLFDNKFIKTKRVLTKEVMIRANALELDGYCKDLKIAFEYQGHPSHWDINYKLYNEVHERDVLKTDMCKKLGIILIVIPRFKNQKDIWVEKNVLNHIKEAIFSSYKENNLLVPTLNEKKFSIDFKKISSTRESLKEIKDLAEINNGKLLIKKWHGNDFKYKFQFDSGEIFFRSAKDMKRSGWPKDKEKYLKRYALLSA